MNFKIIWLVVGVLIFITQSACDVENVANCDEEFLTKCKRWELKDNSIVDCSNTGLESIPKGLPSRTTHLYLNNNGIKFLHSNSFAQSKGGCLIL